MIDAKLVDPELRSLTLVKDSSGQGAFYTARQTKSEDDNYEVGRASGLHGHPKPPTKPSEIGISAGLKRINGLLAWWRIPDFFEASQMEALAKRSQVLIVDLVKLFNEASSDQGQALFASNDRFTCVFQDLLKARQPQDLMVAQSSLLMGLMQSLAAQTKIWAVLTQKLSDCSSTMIREADVKADEQAGVAEPAGKQAAEDPSGRSPKPKIDLQSTWNIPMTAYRKFSDARRHSLRQNRHRLSR